MKPLNLLFIFTPVGRVQDPMTAGVRKAMFNIYKALSKRGHQITLLAPTGSFTEACDIRIIQIEGKFQAHLLDNSEDVFYPIFENSFLQNALNFARIHQKEYDIIINYANDWLPYYLTTFFETPIIHRMNLSDGNAVVSYMVRKIAEQFPNRVGVLTKAQAKDVGIEQNSFIVGQGLDLDIFPFFENLKKRKHLAFIGRISTEKGLEDAAEIARRSNHKLLVFGFIQNPSYFDKIMKEYSDTIIHKGHVEHEELTAGLESCKALIFTPKCQEAFGGVIIQSMACGIPVISYAIGGPKEVVIDGKTGFLVPPNDIEKAVAKIGQLSEISPRDCRDFVENNYSLSQLGDTYEKWFAKVMR